MKTIRPTKLEPRLQLALAGVKKALPPGISLPRNGVSLTQGQLVRQLEELLALFQKVRAAKDVHRAAVAARRTAEPAARESLVQLRAALLSFYGRQSPHLAEFGMTGGSMPPKQVKKLKA